MSRFMRLLVMFDLPVTEKEERKVAARFRNFLLKDGYYMMQFSVYVRICNGIDGVNKHKMRLLRELPRTGSVRSLVVTERQFENMEFLVGEKVLDADEPRKENKVIVF
jgi:hypothetical protein